MIEKAPRTEPLIRMILSPTVLLLQGFCFFYRRIQLLRRPVFGIREERITSRPERVTEAWKGVDSSPLFRKKREFVSLFSNFSDSGRFQIYHVTLAH